MRHFNTLHVVAVIAILGASPAVLEGLFDSGPAAETATAAALRGSGEDSSAGIAPLHLVIRLAAGADVAPRAMSILTGREGVIAVSKIPNSAELDVVIDARRFCPHGAMGALSEAGIEASLQRVSGDAEDDPAEGDDGAGCPYLSPDGVTRDIRSL